MERSGGLTGIPLSREMNIEELPSKLVNVVKKNIINKKSSSVPLKSTPKGAGDYYNYRISIQDGENQKIIECNEYDIQGDLKSLVKYIEKRSNTK